MTRQTFVESRGAWPKWPAISLAAFTLLAGIIAIPSARTQEPEKPNVREQNTRPGNRVPANRPAEGRDAPSAISRLAMPSARNVVFTEEREAAARAFVHKNRPEMEAVLDQLKAAKPREYQQVICDLFRSSELFAALRQEDRERGDLSLKIWRVEAKTHLLAAELASPAASGQNESERLKLELRKTIEELADLQVENAAVEVKRAQAKLRRAEGVRTKLENRKSEFVNERVDAILQAIGKLELGRGVVPEAKTEIE